jgi:HPt (histidine-containing phosphotransfer) domain-containing protein
MDDSQPDIINLEAARNALNIDTMTLARIIRDFLLTREDYLGPLREYLRGGRWEDFQDYAHRLKGAASNLRLERLESAAAALEEQAKNRAKGAERQLSQVEREFALIEQQITEAGEND